MWTRDLLKRNAKESLKNYYWLAFGVILLAYMLGGAESSASVDFSPLTDNMDKLQVLYEEEGNDAATASLLTAVTLFGIALIGIPLNFAFYAFLGGPVNAGKCHFFYEARNGNVQFKHLFSNFGEGKYMATVKIMFLRYLYTTLWTLLFIIPGIIKSYEYYLIPYLLAENPHLTKERAFEISRRTMDGEKMNLFVLELSFIGWYLLGLLACCVGMYFVMPYEQATYTEFYACMRTKAIAQGITSEEELTGSTLY